MKLLGKGCLEKPQHEAMYTVCGCIVQYMKFLILKQHAVLYCTLLKLCMLDLAVVPSVPRRLSSHFSTCIQQIASLKDIMYIYCYKNNRQQIFIYYFSTGINVCSFASFFLFCFTFYQRKSSLLSSVFLWSP